jgi:two-component system chemotaxis response regulator CheY
MNERNIRAMVCDDSPMIRTLEKSALRGVGITDVVEAKDGSDALPLLEAEKFDILVLDWMMPNVHGIEVARILREGDGPNKDIMILMVTAEASKDNVLQISKYKVNGYVLKPFTTEILEKKLKILIKRLPE